MKKLVSILFVGIFVIMCTVTEVFAENFHYKLYNTRTKEVSSSIMMSLSFDDNSYVIAFMTNQGPCAILNTENKENGLLGGSCQFPSDDGDVYAWKEYKQNTFNTELKSIINERSVQGKYIPDEFKHFYTVSE